MMSHGACVIRHHHYHVFDGQMELVTSVAPPPCSRPSLGALGVSGTPVPARTPTEVAGGLRAPMGNDGHGGVELCGFLGS